MNSIFDRIMQILVILFFALIFYTSITTPVRNDRLKKQEIKLLKEAIIKKQHLIDSITTTISTRQDTIRIIEQRQNIYTTKTIHNEKVILLASDSINNIIYQNNKRKFFEEWMQGRYTPARYK
jgi:sensor domain CHASE-containing protein